MHTVEIQLQIDEETATGISSRALDCYLYKYGILDLLKCDSITFKQGYSTNMTLEINLRLNVKENDIYKVEIARKVLNIDSREIEIQCVNVKMQQRLYCLDDL